MLNSQLDKFNLFIHRRTNLDSSFSIADETKNTIKTKQSPQFVKELMTHGDELIYSGEEKLSAIRSQVKKILDED